MNSIWQQHGEQCFFRPRSRKSSLRVPHVLRNNSTGKTIQQMLFIFHSRSHDSLPTEWRPSVLISNLIIPNSLLSRINRFGDRGQWNFPLQLATVGSLHCYTIVMKFSNEHHNGKLIKAQCSPTHSSNCQLRLQSIWR